MTTAAVLGVDIGTSSSKAVLVSLAGDVLATATREHRVDLPAPGHVEMDPAVWWHELCALTRELLAARDVAVAAVGVSGMGPCVVLADGRGAALRPAILYGVDTRAEAEIEELTRRYGEDELAARSGSLLSTQAVGPKLAWLAAHEPDAFAGARKLLMPSSWLVYRLTGAYVLDHHSASQSDPLYDIEAERWYEPWWDDLAPGIERPALLWPGDAAGTVTAAAAQETGLPEGTPVLAGTVDAWAEAVSGDAHNLGDLMLMYGSTLFFVHTVDRLLRSPVLWSTVGAYPGTRSLAAGMATSGSITAWLRDLFGGSDYGELVAEAAASPAGAHGLLLLPYFAGERTPFADPRARGVLAGLTLAHTRGDLYRSALEATAFGVRHNLEALEASGAEIARIVAVGGGTTGALWTQIVSDVTGREQVVPAKTVGASYGDAYLAACAVSQPSIADWNPPAEIVRPRREHEALYDDLYELYRDLYPATAATVHALADEQIRSANPALAGQKGSTT
ncbi:MAG TPA: FGGY family carbohydrate kinase [Gaiellaceae bacterium]|nr:FGGY family carbohydrate kinase [Gaiellaceae bacterium]